MFKLRILFVLFAILLATVLIGENKESLTVLGEVQKRVKELKLDVEDIKEALKSFKEGDMDINEFKEKMMTAAEEADEHLDSEMTCYQAPLDIHEITEEARYIIKLFKSLRSTVKNMAKTPEIDAVAVEIKDALKQITMVEKQLLYLLSVEKNRFPKKFTLGGGTTMTLQDQLALMEFMMQKRKEDPGNLSTKQLKKRIEEYQRDLPFFNDLAEYMRKKME